MTRYGDVPTSTDGLTKPTLREAKKLGSLGVPVFFSEFSKGQMTHGCALKLGTRGQYDRRYCFRSIPAILVA